MTTFDEAELAAYQLWYDNVPSLLDEWRFGYEAKKEPEEGQLWARISFQNTDGGQYSLGAVGERKFRRQAVIAVQIFTPRGEGPSRANQVAQAVVELFEGAAHSALDFHDAVVRPTPPSEEEKFSQLLVTIDCDFFQTR